MDLKNLSISELKITSDYLSGKIPRQQVPAGLLQFLDTPQNANTYSGTLVTPKLEERFTLTNLTNVFAPLWAFSVGTPIDMSKPLAQIVVKHVTSGATAQVNPTNFESGDSTVAALTIQPAQISLSFQVSNADNQGGLRAEDLYDLNMDIFRSAVLARVTALLTTANFPQGLISSSASFGFSDLANLAALLKKSTRKNLVMDGSYIARISNSPSFLQTAGTLGGDDAAWKKFGWDTVANNTDWSAAGANVVGFANHPTAIICSYGVPAASPFSVNLERKDIELPGIGLTVCFHRWLNASTRTSWASFDTVIGAQVGDTTAGYLVTSA